MSEREIEREREREREQVGERTSERKSEVANYALERPRNRELVMVTEPERGGELE